MAVSFYILARKSISTYHYFYFPAVATREIWLANISPSRNNLIMMMVDVDVKVEKRDWVLLTWYCLVTRMTAKEQLAK